MKPVKAIDLVWKAQPMIATLREILRSERPRSHLVDHADEWLASARELLERKDSQK